MTRRNPLTPKEGTYTKEDDKARLVQETGLQLKQINNLIGEVSCMFFQENFSTTVIALTEPIHM
ncbi:hypothetical protein ZOSMA_561G00010 [Zostera marina]|uniref:Uncharacterized protein n=1 Tax=Zostera marina TaxID=29655 RepID=A0A0K9NYD1_ZOSMR|nr:hypothetical protein ZOSMA_561G00010 [Zostera marina]